MDPKAALKDYLRQREITPGAFARVIEYDRGNFHRLLNSPKTWPSLDLALRIEQQTNGAIPIAAWAEAKAA